ncbi:pleiotropic drug resistance protein 1-like protein [Tanacetum coccineum]
MKDQGVGENRLLLLKGVSGAFRPGVLTALMGVSGAGKTTLMDVLAGRKTGGYIEGDIKVSGYPKKQETFARISGYCEQNDIHSPHVTVYESLIYSAWLRLSSDVDENQRKAFVDQVMDLVELNPLRNSLVGLPGVNGLSTEQRKRLTIAVELVANPSIIFMDEPTSGLDARAAAIVMRAVRNTVDTGRTVVCTIHQPSIDIFEAFDELFLMKRGGLELYVGPIGRNSCKLIEYFEAIKGVSKITDGYNPATWMLEVSTSAQEVSLGVDFTSIYRNSELYKRKETNLKCELSVPRPGTQDLYYPTLLLTVILHTMHGVFMETTKRNDQQDLINSMGSMYGAVLFLGIQNASTVQPVVDIERTVFYRERAAGMYSALPYAFSQVLVEIPYIFAQAVVYIASPQRYHRCIIAAPRFMECSILLGFIIHDPWYYWGNPLAWTIYGMVVAQYGDITDTFANGDITVKDFLDTYLGMKRSFIGVTAGVHVGLVLFFAFVFAYSIRSFNFQKR